MSEPLLNRSGFTTEWVATDYLLRKAEIGVEYANVGGNLVGIKVGDGITHWNALAYFSTGTGVGGDIPQNFSDLSDAASVDLVSLNGPLASALAQRLPVTAGAVGTTNLADGAVNSVKLAPITTKTVLGRSTLGTGPVEGVPVTTLAVDLGLPDKADRLDPIDLGTSTLTLDPLVHGNHPLKWRGSADTTLPTSTVGAVDGMIFEVAHTGPSGTLTLGCYVPPGKKATLAPGEVGSLSSYAGVWRSNIPDPGADTGGTTPTDFVLATITPATAVVGQVLTCTPATGWTGTFQWTRNGTNISGATSGTYTLTSPDGGTSVGCKFTPTLFTPAAAAIGGGAGGAFLTYTPTTYALSTQPVGVNFTTDGATDWWAPRGGGDYTFIRKATAPGGTTPVDQLWPYTGDAINGISAINGTQFGNFNPYAAPDDVWTDGVTESGVVSSTNRGAHGNVAMSIEFNGGPEPWGGLMAAPADLQPHRVKLLIGLYADNNPSPSAVRLQVDMSGSGAPTALDLQIPVNGSEMTWTEYDFHYQAPADGRALNFHIVHDSTGGRTDPSGSKLVIARVRYYAVAP